MCISVDVSNSIETDVADNCKPSMTYVEPTIVMDSGRPFTNLINRGKGYMDYPVDVACTQALRGLLKFVRYSFMLKRDRSRRAVGDAFRQVFLCTCTVPLNDRCLTPPKVSSKNLGLER